MFKLFFTSLFLLLLTACTPNSTINIFTPNSTEALKDSTILKLPIPVREHGYSNFQTKVFTTQQEFETFISEIKKQKSWNQKQNFLDSLALTPIDFTQYNLLIYRITEGSGSTVLAVDAPTGTTEHIVITIGRDKPEMGTADMAYYALAYKVAKSVKDVSFDNGIKKELILNKSTELSTNGNVPKSCLAWYDGCNNCGRVGKEVVCTERYCIHHDAFKCTKWKN